jgi:hypothetical protein
LSGGNHHLAGMAADLGGEEQQGVRSTLKRDVLACVKKRELLRRDDMNTLLDEICGVALTHLSGLAARCSNDLTVRRKIDAVVF